jgi:hypothetical protein
MYPGHNRGDQLCLNMTSSDQQVSIVTGETHDSFGKRAMSATLPVGRHAQHHARNCHRTWQQVNVSAGDITKTERLVIQRQESSRLFARSPPTLVGGLRAS